VKLLLLAENWAPRIGGIETYLSGLATALRDQGVAVDVVEPSRRRFFWPVLKPAWLPLFVWLYRRAKREKYDVILCGKALFEGQVGYYLKKYLGIPYIVFTYAMEIEVWLATPKHERALKRVLSSADRVGYINEVTKQALLAAGVKPEQLMKLAPALPNETLRQVPAESALRIRHKYDLAEKYILSVGRLIPRKGFDALLAAFALLDQTQFTDVQLVIVGDGPEYEQLDALAAREMVENSVHFITDASDEDLAALYAGAAVFALTPRELPNDYEGFGIVYLEAAARGVPAIGTRTGGVPEAVLHEETGLLVPPDDPMAVRDVLERLLSDRALRERLGTRARERVEQEFLWEQRAKMLHNVLAEVVK